MKKGQGYLNLGRRKMKKPPSPILKYECVHDDEVAGTAAHNEQVEDLVAAEVFVAAVEEWQL